MLHGREYSKRSVRVNTPMGRASGPPTGLIRARVSRTRPSSPIEAANVSRTSTPPRQNGLRRHDLARKRAHQRHGSSGIGRSPR